jgi:hypothetical protein
MDTKKDNSDILELLGKAWNDKDGKIVIITPNQEEEIRQLIRSRRNTQSDKLFRNKAFMLAFCGIVLFYLFANLRLYITDIKYFLPFVGLTLVFGFSVFYYARVLHLILDISNPQKASKDVALYVAKLRILEKKEMIYSLAIAMPVLIVCLPPITSLTFNRLDFYQNITAYLPAIIVSIVLSLIGSYVYYSRNIEAINGYANLEKSANTI